MADRPGSINESKSVRATHLNSAEVFEDQIRQESAGAKTGLSSSDSSLPGLISRSYADLWSERPVAAAATTIGVAAAGGAAMWKFPKATAYSVGAYGVTKLVLTDGPDLMSSNGTADTAKYGLACASDLVMAAGTAARFIPKVKGYSSIITASGITGRLGAELLPETKPKTFYTPSNFKHLVPKSQTSAIGEATTAFKHGQSPRSDKMEVAVPLASGQTEKRSYGMYVPNSTDEALPVVLLLSGVENDGAPGVQNESRLNELAAERGFIAVYPQAKERDQAVLGKVRDWNSPGAGLTDSNASYDDVDYIKGVIDGVKQNAKVDEKAIYVVGFSSGGEFAQHLRGRLPGTFAGVGSIHGTLLGSEAKPAQIRAEDRSAFISVHSDGDHMLPYNGGRGFMTLPLDKVSSSKPQLQLQEAARANGMVGIQPRVMNFDNIRVTTYGDSSLPVREYYIQGGARGGIAGGLFGRGRDGIPTSHALDGTGDAGGRLSATKTDRSTPPSLLLTNC